MKAFLFAALLALPCVLAYPAITLGTPYETYVASSSGFDGRATPYVTTGFARTYDYVDGFEAGYSTAAQDIAFYDHDWDDRVTYRVGGHPTYPPFPYNRYDVYYTDRDCDYGRRDICLHQYHRCERDRWCRNRETNIPVYHYYNPYGGPIIIGDPYTVHRYRFD